MFGNNKQQNEEFGIAIISGKGGMGLDFLKKKSGQFHCIYIVLFLLKILGHK